MSQQPAYRHLNLRPLPNAEYLVKRILSLPIHEKLDDGQIDYVSEQVANFNSTVASSS
jgi:dTDP-4-amino-4,6-dideoxygalactose transaminase